MTPTWISAGTCQCVNTYCLALSGSKALVGLAGNCAIEVPTRKIRACFGSERTFMDPLVSTAHIMVLYTVTRDKHKTWLL